MSSLKQALFEQGMKVIADPRVSKWMQDERVIQTVTQMLSVPGKVRSFTQDQIDKLTRALSLATEEEVSDLRRQIRRLEDELARLEREK